MTVTEVFKSDMRVIGIDHNYDNYIRTGNGKLCGRKRIFISLNFLEDAWATGPSPTIPTLSGILRTKKHCINSYV